MQIINYFLASIISYIGLLAGIMLIKMAPEEQKPGRKYFILIKKIIFFLMIAFLLFYYRINVILALSALLFIGIIIAAGKLRLEKSALVYFLLGIIFFLSSKITDLFAIESTLIFLYGIPAASLLFDYKKRNYVEIFVRNLWFFVPALSLYLLINYHFSFLTPV
ncbi:hypothetical protein HYU09_01950 [Candidatus Woesearchaeota archaeon]|nr:hypothetical protein [Candidatus Woesearchaeota archaeon]